MPLFTNGGVIVATAILLLLKNIENIIGQSSCKLFRLANCNFLFWSFYLTRR